MPSNMKFFITQTQGGKAEEARSQQNVQRCSHARYRAMIAVLQPKKKDHQSKKDL